MNETNALVAARKKMLAAKKNQEKELVTRFLAEMENNLDNLSDSFSKHQLHENLSATLRKKLLGGRIASRKEKELILNILDELKRIMS